MEVGNTKSSLSLKKGLVLAVPLFVQVLFRDKPECRRVEAIAKSVRLGSVIKDMPQVGVRLPAPHLCPRPEEAPVLLLHNIPRLKGSCKAWPPCPGIVLVT